jgi:hypothetical protein
MARKKTLRIPKLSNADRATLRRIMKKVRAIKIAKLRAK